jgi:SMODS and SLOG-associating 2TM effector domain family 5
MSERTHVQECLSELLRRTEITSKARYTAARRMELHNTFSQWTLAFLAVGQIVIALVVALKLRTNYPPAYMDFGGIFFGVLVLTYSLLLGMGNFAARAIMLHSCGVELGGLSRKLHLQAKSRESAPSEYEEAAKRYYEILSKCENHIALDYMVARRDAVDKKLEDAPFLSREHIFARTELIKVFAKIWISRIFQYFHYAASVTIIGSWIYKMVC